MEDRTNQTSPKDNIISETKDIVTSQVPNSGVFEIKQDRKGNIWIATNDGVYRYDARPAPKLKRNEKRYNSIDYGENRIPTPRCVSSRTETFEAGVYWFVKTRTRAKNIQVHLWTPGRHKVFLLHQF